MKQLEYQITLHSSESFKEVIYFCSEDGSCKVEEVPSEQLSKLKIILNEHGEKGWELVQASFGKQGVMIFWKKPIAGGKADAEGENAS
jgi:hypothetical protein